MEMTGLKYKIVGRYMDGTAVTAYHIIGTNGVEVKASKDLVTYYIGRGMITNAKCQPSSDGNLIIRGMGINLNDLPVKNERTGEIKDSHGGQSINVAARTNKKNMLQMEIIARLFNGNRVIGYVIRDSYGNEKKIDRDTIMKMAEAGRISNARIAQDGDDKVLRGIGCKIDELPRMRVSKDNKIEVIDEIKEKHDKDSVKIDKKNFSKTVDVTWDEVKEASDVYSKTAVRDEKSNAQGGYKYPIMEVVESKTAKMFIDIGLQRYSIEEIEAGTCGIDNSYGIRMLLTNINEGIEVRCKDISYLAFHAHNIGLIAFVALSKLHKYAKLSELYFSDSVNYLMWREYFGDYRGNNNEKENTTKNRIVVDKSDILAIDRIYNVELSPVSRLGHLKKYPTVNMIMSKTARLSVKTISNYYECESLSVSGVTDLYINIVLVNSRGQRKLISYEKMNKEQLNMKNILIICSAAFKGTEQIENVMAENNIENSVIAYDFNIKMH